MNIKNKQRLFPDSVFVCMYHSFVQSFISAIEEYAKGRNKKTDSGMEMRLEDDASVHSPGLINRASHAALRGY